MRGDPVRWRVTDADTDPDADSDELNMKQQINRVATVAASSVVENQKRRRMLTFVACNNCREKKKSVGGLSVLLPAASSVQLPALRPQLSASSGVRASPACHDTWGRARGHARAYG
jgi:hypothetical protein